ncbi:MAG: hypothetical protein AMJ81_10080 [Phycisphaerae bacterium SM23_33]|nr:MAG: hypothetical protein AMJ81_10080 [Phycisphaerae bacterium SM23_33]
MSGEILAIWAHPHLPLLLVAGVAIFAGTFGAGIFQRLRIPHVVAYIAIGLLVGRSGLGVVDGAALNKLLPFNAFALGVIGFMIGGELRREVFKKYGRQFIKILLAEGLGAFVMVGLLVGAMAMVVTGRPVTSVALGLLFGALASATAPAATVSVLWEYKARGVLTTMTYAIVALDDALAVILFSVCASLVAKLMGQGGVGLLRPLGQAAYELVGGAGLGAAAGAGLNFLLRRTRDYNKAFPFILSALLLLIGVGTALKVDTILAAMALGATLVNLAPRRSGGAFEIVERFAPPVYVLFFVMVGASLDIRGMPAWMWGLALPYVIGRTAGKMLGANFGARLAKAAPAVRKYLGLCLFSQGGVAVGLSIVASQRFAGPNGAAIITIIAVTTFIVEILGPPFVKLAIQRAGEAGLNVTEEDLMGSYRVGDMVDRESPAFAENTTVASMLRTIAGTDATCYPVTNADKKLAGVIRLQELKESFGGEGLADWLVALDVMQPVPDTITEDAPLAEAVARMREQQLDYLPVVKTDDNSILVGMLELRAVNRALTQEVLRRQRLADGEAT